MHARYVLLPWSMLVKVVLQVDWSVDIGNYNFIPLMPSTYVDCHGDNPLHCLAILETECQMERLWGVWKTKWLRIFPTYVLYARVIVYIYIGGVALPAFMILWTICSQRCFGITTGLGACKQGI